MGYLDNAGSILLDAVLTDLGRSRLAKGDGSFKVVKFAVADDEIDYGLYNYNHASGSDYYDLEIMQLPVLEAFTDNGAGMKHKLISIPRTNLLYLPVVKVNTLLPNTTLASDGVYYVVVDKETEDSYTSHDTGVLFGENPAQNSNHIRIDQGLDTTEIPSTFVIDGDLIETQYIVEIDNRFGNLVSIDSPNFVAAKPSYVDDDNIASYFFSLGSDTNFVKDNSNPSSRHSETTEAIAGPRGTVLSFKIKASVELNSSTYLFETLGTEDVDAYYLESFIRVTGATTGASVDIPVIFTKMK